MTKLAAARRFQNIAPANNYELAIRKADLDDRLDSAGL